MNEPRHKDDKIRCDACPVMCYIAEGRSGACDRYANDKGDLVRVDPLKIIERNKEVSLVPFAEQQKDWDGTIVNREDVFVTAIGAGTTYPDYKPAPFIIGSKVDGVDIVTVVTEGIYSYCGVKVKVDTDRHIGPENLCQSQWRTNRTCDYGRIRLQMLSIGGVNHLTGGSKKEGRATCSAMLSLCNQKQLNCQ